MLPFFVSQKKLLDTVDENKTFQVVYSRPFKNDRLIFGAEKDGALVPFGKYWRTILMQQQHLKHHLIFCLMRSKLRAGKYALFTFPNSKSWKIANWWTE